MKLFYCQHNLAISLFIVLVNDKIFTQIVFTIEVLFTVGHFCIVINLEEDQLKFMILIIAKLLLL